MKVSMHTLLLFGAVAAALAVSPLATAVAGAEPAPATAANADYALGFQAVQAKDWDRAVQHLENAARAEPRNADVQNLLGFTFRNQKKYELAFTHYRQALTLDPDHRGAHEYIGEAYVLTGNSAKATEHLVALLRICGKNCEEYQDLARAIAKR